jgi:uncharacterized protein DUF4440
MPDLLALLAAAAIAAPAAQPVNVPPQPQLTEEIRQADLELFKLYFTGKCDAARFRSMLRPDVEFYHDKAGFNIHSADEFVANYMDKCRSRDDPKSTQVRRELIASSYHVDPVPGWGAIEIGEHLFYEVKGENGPEHLVGRAAFAQLWVLEADGKWRLSRVLSYSHQPAS